MFEISFFKHKLIQETTFVWSGTGWTLGQFSSVPTRESRVAGLDFVELQFDPMDPRNLARVTNIEFDTFKNLIQSNILNTENDKIDAKIDVEISKNVINAEIKKLDSQISELKERRRTEIYSENGSLKQQKRENQRKIDSTPVVKAIDTMLGNLYYAEEINISENVKLMISDKETLIQLIKKTAEEMKVNMSTEDASLVADEVLKIAENKLRPKKSQSK